MLFQGGFSIENTDVTDRIQLLGLDFADLLQQHGISRLLTRPNGSALWKPATFEKVDKAFKWGNDTVLGWRNICRQAVCTYFMDKL